MRTLLRLIFLPIVCLVALPILAIGYCLRRREDIEDLEEQEEALVVEDPEEDHDDWERSWLIDLSPGKRIDRIERAWGSQASEVQPIEPFSQWVARRRSRRSMV